MIQKLSEVAVHVENLLFSLAIKGKMWLMMFLTVVLCGAMYFPKQLLRTLLISSSTFASTKTDKPNLLNIHTDQITKAAT